MNILYVITKAERGGAQQHVRDLAISFKREHHIHVAIGESTGWLYEEMRREGIATSHIALKRGWNPFSFFGFARRLSKLMWQEQPDIVHFHSSHTIIGAWFVKLFFHPAKSVVTLHGLSLLADPSSRPSVAKWIYQMYLSVSLRAADKVICVSDADVVIAKKIFPSISFQKVHNGIGTPTFLSRTEARERLELPQDAFVVGTLGRFAYPKNQSFLLAAFSKWQNKNAILCLIGNGPDRDRLILDAKNVGVFDRVVFADGDATHVPAFDLFVLPSQFEGLPYVLLEAALAHIPIIATNVGGVSELITHKKTGLLVRTDDVVGLTNAIDELAAHEQSMRVYADAAFEFVATHFSCTQMCQETEQVYQKCVSI